MAEYLKELKTNKLKFLLIALLFAATIAGGVNHWSGDATANPPEGAAQAMPVEVVTVKPTSVRSWSEFSGRVTAVDFVEVRPQVSGRITAVLFEEGALVNKGDSLFVIDERPFKAALAAAESRFNAASSELRRAKGLVSKNYVSKSVLDQRNSEYRAAEAALTTARLNIEYSQVKAPISGRISRAEITEGNLIDTTINPPVLTTIISTDKVYGEFDVDEKTYLQSIRSQGKLNEMPVELRLASGDTVVYSGTIHSFDNRLNSSSGTIRARAIFDNKDGALVPGMFANIKLGSPTEEKEILISEKAVGTDQGKRFVFVASKDNKVEYREIVLGSNINGMRVVKSGLVEGDKVITSNSFMLRPDMPIMPTEAGEKKSDIATEPQKIAAKN